MRMLVNAQASLDRPRGDARATPRTNMFVLAAMTAGSASGPVRIRNMSSGGAMIEGASLPSHGDFVELRRGNSYVSGTVAWCHGGKAGLQFEGRPNVAEWMPGAAGQQRIDNIVYQAKADAGLRIAPTMPEGDSGLCRMRLRRLAQQVDALADELADDPEIIARLGPKLQTLDMASQALRKLSNAQSG